MRIVLRADAGPTRGAGHIMRCLTLAEALIVRGHEVILMASIDSVPWLQKRIDQFDIDVVACAPDTLDIEALRSLAPDWVVVDSYWIEPEQISSLNRRIACLAIIDGDDRGIDAALYVEQNFGSETIAWREQVRDRVLSGATFAMIRDEVLEQRRERPEIIRHNPPRVVAFLGGTDPLDVIVDVVLALISSRVSVQLTAVCNASSLEPVRALAAAHPWITVLEQTPALPQLLGDADIVISAAGTSAWEICTLAIPSIAIGIVENQREGMVRMRELGFTVVVEAMDGAGRKRDEIGAAAERLVNDAELRSNLSARCREYFDGNGKVRVVEAMEAHFASCVAAKQGPHR